MTWTGKHRAFIVENFLPNGESVTASLRNFRNHFELSRHDPVPDSKTLLLWVKTLELQAQHSSGNPLEDQEAFKLQRTSKLLKNPFCGFQGVQLVSILLH